MESVERSGGGAVDDLEAGRSGAERSLAGGLTQLGLELLAICRLSVRGTCAAGPAAPTAASTATATAGAAIGALFIAAICIIWLTGQSPGGLSSGPPGSVKFDGTEGALEDAQTSQQ